jgi:hypothetical protein
MNLHRNCLVVIQNAGIMSDHVHGLILPIVAALWIRRFQSLRWGGSNFIASRSQVGDPKFPKIVGGSSAEVMGISSRYRRPNPGRQNGNTKHRITIQVCDLTGDNGGGLHVKDQIALAGARLHGNARSTTAGVGLRKSGVLDHDNVLSGLHVVNRELTFRIGNGRILCGGWPCSSIQLHVCFSDRLLARLL